MSKNLNLLLISVDTLRTDHMGVYGYKKNTTPNIDRWAKNAFVVTNAYTVMPITFHSFYTLFTGKDEVLKNGIIANRYITTDKISDAILTVPKILKENNFRTGAFITNPVIGEASLNFFSDGFQDFEYINTSGIYSNEKIPDINVYSYDFENAKEVTKRGVEWIEVNKENRFFLWLHYTTPHTPYNPPKEYLCKITKDCNSKVYNDLLTKYFTEPERVLKSCSYEGNSPEIINAYRDLYDGEILSVDEQIGLVLKEIEGLSLSKKTVVVLYGDHGEGFDHNTFGHGNALYHSAIRIPLIIKIPSTAPRTITNLLDNSDILPTILDILKIQYDEKHISGRSFMPILSGKKASSSKQNIYSIATTEEVNKRSIFDGTYKYIQSLTNYCLNESRREELYNLKTDPEETDNLASEDVEIKNKLKNLLDNSDVISKTEVDPETKLIIDKLKSLGY